MPPHSLKHLPSALGAWQSWSDVGKCRRRWCWEEGMIIACVSGHSPTSKVWWCERTTMMEPPTMGPTLKQQYSNDNLVFHYHYNVYMCVCQYVGETILIHLLKSCRIAHRSISYFYSLMYIYKLEFVCKQRHFGISISDSVMHTPYTLTYVVAIYSNSYVICYIFVV